MNISSYSEINSDWLLFGKGQMIKKQEQFQKNLKIEEKPEKPYKSPILQKNAEINFDGEIPGNTETQKKGAEQGLKQKVSPKSEIERIIVFYADKSFEEYSPNK